MIGMELNLMDLVGGFVAFFLTLFVLSYALGDNALFRLAIHLFIGVSAGFVLASAFYGVLWPQLLRPIAFGTTDERLASLVPFLLALLLAAKAFPRISFLGSPVTAFLVGVGAATVVGGALLGTLFPQAIASMSLLDVTSIIQSGGDVGIAFLNGGLVLLGLIVTLASFQFGTRIIHSPSIRPIWKLVYWIGRFFIAITFGVIFAGVLAASLTALVERFQFILQFLLSFISPTP